VAQSQTIPNTLLSGSQTFTFLNTDQVYTNATITIDRTITGGLNSASSALILGLSFDYSLDGGTTWLNIGGSTLIGGTIVTKGVTLASDTLGVGIGQPFPLGTSFRVDTVVNAGSVEIAGTVVYS
jgi:hypothetical protein